MKRNRLETEKRLMASARSIIETSGFEQFGVNQIAQRASCDKVLIYRYFGGFEGLCEALAGELSFFPEPSELWGPGGDIAVRQIARAYGVCIRESALLSQMLKWGRTQSNPISAEFAIQRERFREQMKEVLRPQDRASEIILEMLLLMVEENPNGLDISELESVSNFDPVEQSSRNEVMESEAEPLPTNLL